MNITPAGIQALANGDIENFLVASTPGGIEVQEATGQTEINEKNLLPIQEGMSGNSKENLEMMGVKVISESDDLFYNVELPDGWKMEPSDHSMWSYLLDDKGRERASIFYKAAFYDRNAHISFTPRFKTNYVSDNGGSPKYDYQKRKEGKWKGIVTDGGKIVFETESKVIWNGDDESYWDGQKKLEQEAKDWLIERYPNYHDKFEYWEE